MVPVFRFISFVLAVIFMLVFVSSSRAGTTALQALGGYTAAAVIGVPLLITSLSIDGDAGLALALSIPPAVVLGSSIIVYWIGNSRENLDGSYTWTLIGASTSIVAGAIIGAAVNRASPNGFPEAVLGALIGYIIGSVGSPAGAVIGYRLSCRNELAARNMQNDLVRLGIHF